MKALINCESVFGNTEKISHAAAEGMGEYAEVSVVEPGDAPTGSSAGSRLACRRRAGPAFGMSRAISRRDAGKNSGILSAGSARRPIASWLKKRGCGMIDNGEGFFVTGTEGPLEAGELDRAREWGRTLAKKAAGKSGSASA